MPPNLVAGVSMLSNPPKAKSSKIVQISSRSQLPPKLHGVIVETALKAATIAMTVEERAVVEAGAQGTSVIAAVIDTIHHMVMTRIGNSKMANTGKKQPKRPKHVPLRTCIACRESKPKRELLRVVRTPDGHVVIDPTSKKPGRGAYLCARLSCWETAIKKKRLEREFELTLSDEDRAGLDAFIATLPKEPSVVK